MVLLRLSGRTARSPVPGRRSRDAPGSTVRLSDGRRLAYVEHGDLDGSPILFFNGLGTSRVVRHPDDSIAERLGVRLIAVDRPGIGPSDPLPQRTLLGWPRDVGELADRLGVGRFAVLGWSGGGAYALATAHQLPSRVHRVGIVSGPAPLCGDAASPEYLDRWLRTASRASRHAPWMIRLALWHWGRPQRRDPEGFLHAAAGRMVDADRAVLGNPRLRTLMIENAAEVYRHGWQGIVQDGLILARPWGFDPREVKTPVHLWHGELDSTVPSAMGRHLARELPHVTARFFVDEGHLLLYDRWAEILDSLRS